MAGITHNHDRSAGSTLRNVVTWHLGLEAYNDRVLSALKECTHIGIACFPLAATALQVSKPRCRRGVCGSLSAFARTLRSMTTNDRDLVKIVEPCADPVRTA